ncbi:MAG: biotin/lipoate A/B protein ligase family protein, partial [Desulfuromonadaceae bacterium]
RSSPLPGDINMALDEVLLNSVAAGRSFPVFRLYRWSPAAVSLGYLQRGERQVNIDYCRSRGIDIVRRITGGRAVLHDREVTYAIMAGIHENGFSKRVIDNYQRISQVLQRALERLGLQVSLVSGRSRSLAGEGCQGVCFSSPSSYELIYRGCKMVGSSQKCRGEVFLQHGSIPVDLDPEVLFSALDTQGLVSPREGGRCLTEKVGWINRWLDSPVTPEQVEACLLSSFVEVFSAELQELPPTENEWRDAETLVRQRYGNPDWTFSGNG